MFNSLLFIHLKAFTSQILCLLVCFALISCDGQIAICCTLDKTEAIRKVERLPEVQKWIDKIEQSSNESVTMLFIIESDTPKMYERKRFWAVNLYEDHESNLHLVKTFMVGVCTNTIMVDDAIEGITELSDWRIMQQQHGGVADAI